MNVFVDGDYVVLKNEEWQKCKMKWVLTDPLADEMILSGYAIPAEPEDMKLPWGIWQDENIFLLNSEEANK